MNDDDFAPVPPSTSTSGGAWMVTFTDLVSLMLTFFVMLFAMSDIKVDKWDHMIDALSMSLNPEQKKVSVPRTSKYNISTTFRRRAVNLDYLAAVIKETVERDPLLRESRVIRMEESLVLALPSDQMFKPGKAILTEGARDAVVQMASVLRNVSNAMNVIGHSDRTPPEGGRFASNWELSIARAAAVGNILRRVGYDDEITVLGYSDSRYHELPDMPDAERDALARRVDIVILPTGGTVR